MAPLALFGIENSGFGLAANLLGIFLIAVWLALAFWTYNDAKRRIDDSVLVSAAAFAALVFPFAGALVYAIVRPPETIDDRYERELDIRAGELRVRMLEQAAKSGSGSSALSSAVVSELAGGVRGGEPKAPPARKKAPAGRGDRPSDRPADRPAPRKSQPDRTPAAARKERPAEEGAQRTSERPATARPSQSARPADEEPRRRPKA